MKKAFNEYGRVLILIIVLGLTLFFIFSGPWFSSIADATGDGLSDINLNDVQSRAAPVIHCQDQSTSVGSEVNLADLISATDADGKDISDKIVVTCSSSKNYNKETKIFKTTDSSEAGVYFFTLTVIDSNSEYNLKTTKKMTITVDDSVGQYSIMIASVKNGILTTDLPSNFAFKDATVTLFATPDPGYKYGGATLKYIVNGKEQIQEIPEGTLHFVMPAANVILIPKWVASTYTVVFDPSGGLCDIENKLVVFDTEYGDLPTPTRAGFVFAGWYIKTNASSKFITKDSKVAEAENHILYASWVPATYKLIFDANGGSCSIIDKDVTFGNAVGELPTPYRPGAVFKGWALPNGSLISKNYVYLSTKNTTLTAQWVASNYKVSFDASGGSCSIKTLNIVFGEPYGVLPIPDKEGYDFIGWYDSVTGGNKVSDTTPVSIAGDHTLYARYTPKSYTITFNPNGGSCDITEIIREHDSLYGNLPVPERIGYTFDGWYTSATSGSLITEASVVSKGITLYAHWSTATLKVSFDANGGSCTTSSKTVTYNGTYGALPTPAKTGMSFTGWHLDTINGPLVTRSTIVTYYTDHTLVASWAITSDHTITFDANGGSCSVENYTRSFGENYGTLPIATRIGYTFDGWFTERIGGRRASIVTVCEGDATLYAQWVPNVYEISFIVSENDKDTVLKTINVEFGTRYNTLPDVLENKENFIGWYTQKEGGELVTSDTMMTVASDHSLYARFTKTGITVTFDANGGTCEPQFKIVNYNHPYGELPTPEKDGYDFAYWYRSGVGGIDDPITSFTTVTVKSDHAIYAKWIPNSYPIVLNLNYPDAPTYPVGYEATQDLKFSNLPKPEREGYEFTGWYREPELINEVTSGTIFRYQDGLELYAGWKRGTCSVSLYLCKEDADIGAYLDIVEVEIGATYKPVFDILDLSSLDDFAGWYFEPECINEVTADTVVTATKDHALYAKLVRDVIVSFDLNYDNAPTYAETIFATTHEVYGTLPIPSRDGYIFAGWYSKDGLLITEDSKVSELINHTLYADWVSTEYSSIYFTDKTEAEAIAASRDDTFHVVNGKPRTQKIDGKTYYVLYDINTTIDGYANNTSIEKVLLADTVVSLGSTAFQNCSNIVRLSIPVTLKISETTMFEGCMSVSDVRFSYGTNGTGVEYSANCYKFLPWLFLEDNATKHITVEIEDNVKYLGGYTFYTSYKRPIIIDKMTTPITLSSIVNTLSGGNITISELRVTRGTGEAIYYTSSSSTSNTYYGNAIWYDSGVEKLIIDDDVAYIGQYYFNRLPLKEITAPITLNLASLNSYNKTTLEKLVLTPGPSNSSSFGKGYNYSSASETPWNYAAESLTVILDPAISSIGNYMFYGCNSLNSINLENITSIGECALCGTNPETVIINDNIEIVGENALRFNSVQNLSLPIDIELYQGSMTPDYITSSVPVKLTLTAGKTGIGVDYYQEEYIASPWGHLTVSELNISDGVTRIGDFAFYDTGYYNNSSNHLYTFTNLNTNNLTEIGAYAFNGCSIENLIIGNKIESIGEFAFEGCPITDLTVPIDYGFEKKDVFGGSPRLSKLHFTAGKTGIGYEYGDNSRTPWYITSEIGWKPFDVTFADDVKTIGESTFYNCRTLRSVNFNNVDRVNSYAFEGCSNCEFASNSENAFSNLKIIEYSAFYGCTNITNVSLDSAGIKDPGQGGFMESSIGDFAFAYTGITELNIGANLKVISMGCFYGCDSLEIVILPSNVQDLEMWAFAECSSLKAVFIPNKMFYINNFVFENCSSDILSIYLERDQLYQDNWEPNWNCIDDASDTYAEVKYVYTLDEFKSENGLS